MRNIANTTELTSAVLARYIASTVGPAKQLIDKVCENTRKGIFRLISMVEAESKFAPLAAEGAYKNVVSHLADANRAYAAQRCRDAHKVSRLRWPDDPLAHELRLQDLFRKGWIFGLVKIVMTNTREVSMCCVAWTRAAVDSIVC